jgi:hypothetical protein
MTGTCAVGFDDIRAPFDTTQPRQESEDGIGVYSAAICVCTNCCDWVGFDPTTDLD